MDTITSIHDEAHGVNLSCLSATAYLLTNTCFQMCSRVTLAVFATLIADRFHSLDAFTHHGAFFTHAGNSVCPLEPFSGVEIHTEMDMEWEWMEMGHNL